MRRARSSRRVSSGEAIIPVCSATKLAAVVALAAIMTLGCGRGTPATPVVPSATCLDSGDETTINAALAAATTVVLCREAVFTLNAPVVFTRDGQRLYTEGFPTDATRATLRIVAPFVSTALVLEGWSHAYVSHLIVDGHAGVLGRLAGGHPLIQAGGDASGQRVEHVRAFEPRGWSTIHAFEGRERRCSGITIAHNELGPAGFPEGEWADGISLACRGSLVHDNTITDATDGGIVVFGAPGSIVAGNTIRAATRPLLAGITMVDYIPFGGDFTRTVVDSNVIEGAGRRIRIGVAMGTRTWTCLLDVPRLTGGVVSHNVLQGEMGYGFAVSGVADWVVMDNRSNARHTGMPVNDCAGRVPSRPGPFQIAREHASGTFQQEFVDATLESALFAFGDPSLQLFRYPLRGRP